jgi:hypothetical protein
MAEPQLYEVFDHEAKLLAQRLGPRRVFLNMDEIRMGGTCKACRGQNMAELLGECITRQTQILRRHMPGVQIYVWSDMLDPHHKRIPGRQHVILATRSGHALDWGSRRTRDASGMPTLLECVHPHRQTTTFWFPSTGLKTRFPTEEALE